MLAHIEEHGPSSVESWAPPTIAVREKEIQEYRRALGTKCVNEAAKMNKKAATATATATAKKAAAKKKKSGKKRRKTSSK